MLRIAVIVFLLTTNAAIAQPVPTPALTTITIATPGQDSNALAYYAQDMGFFKKHGIDATFIAVRGSGLGIAAAVTGNTVDIGEGGLIDVANARLHGIPLALLAPSYRYQAAAPVSALIVAKSSAIALARDLDGKTLGAPSLEGPAKVATFKWLQDGGAKMDTIRFVEIPQPNMAAAVARGTIAAAAINEPSLSAALDEDRIIGYPYSAIGKDVELTAWFATEDWIAAHAVLAQHFTAAMREAAIWANTPANRARSGAIVAHYTGVEAEAVAKMRRAAYGETFEASMMQPFLDAATAQHALATHVDAMSLLSKTISGK